MIADKRSNSNNKNLRLTLLGGFDAIASGAPLQISYAKLRALLAYLALTAGTPHRRAYLTELLWPDMPEATGRQNLRRALFNLKTAMGQAGELLSANRDTVSLSRDGIWLDVSRFTSPPSCNLSTTPSQCAPCLAEMEETLALYRGEFMAGFALPESQEFEEWLQIQRETHHCRALALLEKIAQCHEQAGSYTKALSFAMRFTELAPWNDGAQQRVMRLLALNGQEGAALAQFDAYSRVLKSELGVLPNETSRQLVERIRKGELKPTAAKTAAHDWPAFPPVITERRQVTVLCVELSPLNGDDPDEAMELLRAPQERCLSIIRQFSGHAIQTHGGGLLVYFGYPRAHEHAARHAVLAALAIAKGTDRSVQIRAGLHTGLVISGGDSSLPDTVGRTSKLAIQLRLSAGHGAVVISRQTHDLVRGYFDCVALGTHAHADGAPLEVFQVVRESKARTRLDAAAQLTPMAGRESEMAQLMLLWNKVAQGKRQIVLVQGEAGIGKSRLLHTLKQELRNQPHEIRELLCFPEYRQSPFHPLIAMLEGIFAFVPTDPPETKSAKLTQYLETHFPTLSHTAVPLLTQLLSLPTPENYPLPALSPQKQKEQTMQHLLDLLRALATQQPVLLIVEDLHWIDPSTLELLTLFIGQTGWHSVLMLLTARPEFIPPWRAALDATLAPSPLSEQEAAAMVTAINKELPAQTLHKIFKRTDGIPLFIEEMARCATAESQAVIPASLHDLLAARIDGMGEAKYTAQLAATIGREFDSELLHRVASHSGHATTPHLFELQQSGLIYPINDRSLQFKHALIQEAAYHTLPRSGRQAVHRNIAQTLQSDFPDVVVNQPEIIAQHWSDAGETEQALDYWIKAGQRAARNSANMEAIGHFNAGLDLLNHLPAGMARDRIEVKILVNLCPVLYAAQGYGSHAATQANRRIADLSRVLGDSPELFLAKWAQVMNTIANAGSRTVPPNAHLLLEMAQHDPLHKQAAHYAIANAAFWLGDFATAHDHTTMGLALYRAEQQPLQLEQFGEDLSVSCMAYLCWSLYFLGRPDQAERVCTQMLTQARKLAHPHTLGLALCFASVLHRWLNKPAETLALSAETIAVSRQHGFSVWLAAGEMTHGWALVMCSRNQDGIAELHSSIAGMRAAIGGISVVFLSALIEALIHLGQYDEALEQIDQAFADVASTGDGHFTAELHRLRGICFLGNTVHASKAEACFTQALELSRAQGTISLELRAAISLAHLWKQQDRPWDAPGVLEEVYKCFTEGFDTPLLLEAKELMRVIEKRQRLLAQAQTK